MLTVRNTLVLCMLLAASWGFAGTPPEILSEAWADVGSASVVATDADGDVLTYTWSRVSGPGSVQFTPNGTADSSTVSLQFGAAGTYVLEVSVSDGESSVLSTVTTTIPPVAYAVGRPQVSISGPEVGHRVFEVGHSINFTCEAYSPDTVTGSHVPLTGNQISWTSSLDGPLSQTGASVFVTTLGPGTHTITCTGTNTGGTNHDTIQITVNGDSGGGSTPTANTHANRRGCSFSGGTDTSSLWPILLAILAAFAIWRRQKYLAHTR